MIKKNPEMIYSVVWVRGVAGITGTLIGFGLSNQLAKLAQVRYSVMVPIILLSF